MRDEQLRQREAIVAYASRCTIPILATRVADGAHAHHGSGVLYAARGQHFLTTATHVVESQVEGELHLSLPVVGDAAGEHVERVYFVDDGGADVAVFKLSPRYAAQLEASGWEFVDGEADLDRSHDQYDDILIIGYSAQLSAVTTSEITRAPVAIYTRPLSGTPHVDDLATNARPRVWDILFHWPNQGVTEIARGISGGGVWGIRYSADGLWTPARSLRPIAIETALVPKGAPRWIRSTNWEAVKILIDDKPEKERIAPR